MAMTVPKDPLKRPQWSMAEVIVANAQLGRPPFVGVELIGPDRYWEKTPAPVSSSQRGE
jgi:hypothetical protein